jgi:tetratricopeptide (TPR) repeat protein
MPDTEWLRELLLRWEELREEGEAVSPEQLCGGSPGLLPELRRHIQGLAAMDCFLGLPPGQSPGGPAPDRWRAAGSNQALPTLPGYEILGELGRGGMGIVYKALDRSRGGLVALKVLPWADPAALYRFKKEFRSLAGVCHPNLVSLYELISQGPAWCFTMELVEGVDLLRHVRAGARPGEACDLARLRGALRQLAEGVATLHAAHKLHRDIKPSNVLVTGAGRVVLLDLGLAAELDPSGLQRSTEGGMVGTVGYMAPEQAAALPLSPAGDWYSVGVILYEALTGHLPFAGNSLRVLQDKQAIDPPPPRRLAPAIPADLDALCTDLLRRDPGARPVGRDVLLRLGGEVAELPVAGAPPPAPPPRPPFVGRQPHLQALADALAAMRQGRTVVVHVQGRSGAGKSALVQHFLTGLAEREGAVVLAGRCYEQESVPYKALDSLVDSLSRYLGSLPPSEVQPLLPWDVLQLAAVFPVLRRVEAVARATRRIRHAPDVHELRRRTFAALKELLARLGDRQPLVLFIDDLQWGDLDSAALLADVLQPPDPPVLLLLCAYRSEDVSTSPFLRTFLPSQEQAGGNLARLDLAVGALAAPQAQELARQLLGAGGAAAQADAIAAESEGNPFFVHELVHHLLASGATGHPGEARALTLQEVLRERIRRLPAEARRLLEVVAVAGRPLGRLEACRAAGFPTVEQGTLALLRSGRYLRGTGTGEQDEVETYHDRIREAVVAYLPPDALADVHRRLAHTLEGSGRADPEALGIHFEGAGALGRASQYYALAAAEADQTLAFDRAAKLYRRAAELCPGDGREGRQLRAKLGEALANTGRGAEAARAFLAAAEGAPATEAVELQRRAATQFLVSGHVDEGLAHFRTVLNAIGMKMPDTPRRAQCQLLLRRLQMRFRGLSFRQRDVSRVPPETLTRIDTCWSAFTGLSVIDPTRGAYFQIRGLLLALHTGEPYRIARALSAEAAHVSTAGGPGRKRTAHLLRVAEAVAQQVAHPHALGMVSLAKGIAAYLEGCWKRARTLCDQAEAVFRDRCTGVAWELDTAHTFSLWSLTYMGEVAELTRQRSVLLKEAQERGDRYAITNLSTYIMAVIRLAADDPDGAEKELRQSMAQWSHQGFHVQHHNALLAQTLIDLYRGEGIAAWEHISRAWPSYQGSLLLRVQQVRIDVLQLRARSALAAAACAPIPEPFLHFARRDARRLGREQVPWAEALSLLVRAGISAAQGDRPNAMSLLGGAAARFEAADMGIYAAAARRRLGRLLGGTQGQALVNQADTWMLEQKVVHPGRMTAMLTPGFPE